MKIPVLTIILFLFLASAIDSFGQKRGIAAKARPASARSVEVGQSAFVMDETLSVLRKDPSLFADPIQRMRRGRKVQILGVKDADGVKFYRVAAPPTSFGWVQADAVFGKFRVGDEERLARFVQATDGFDQIEVATEFFTLYPNSKFRPSILLLFGDLLEEVAAKLSKDAGNRLKRSEMAASAAPLHSYYLNYVSLDRYRKIGVVFIFDTAARQFHYNGASWAEIVRKYQGSPEAIEAQKRLVSLNSKMEKPVAK